MNNKASYIALGAMIAILLSVDIFLLARTMSYREEIAIKNETIGELFIPDKSFPKQTNTYLEMISEKYYKP